jgi:hypothetical protein
MKHFFFSEATIPGAAYIDVLENFVVPQLEEEEAELFSKMVHHSLSATLLELL